MIAEAMQGAGIVAAIAVPGGLLMWKWMQSETVLPHGFEDHTKAMKEWNGALAPEGQPKLRSGVRA